MYFKLLNFNLKIEEKCNLKDDSSSRAKKQHLASETQVEEFFILVLIKWPICDHCLQVGQIIFHY